jgi:CHAD domain-containing protein
LPVTPDGNESFVRFRLTKGDPVAKDLTRVVAEEIDAAMTELRKEDESVRDRSIHEARKSIKKLRAIVRMLMPGLGPAGNRDDSALRDTGRALSKLRDAAALIETVEALSERFFADPAMEQLAVVRSVLRRRMEDTVRGEDCRTVVGGAVASLKTLKKRAARWQIAGGSFAAIAPGLEQTYRRGRKRLKLAQANPSAENLHSLRKRVKDHWYQVRLLDGPWRMMQKGRNSRDKELRELQEWLGDHHNLTVLRDAIQAEPVAFGIKKIVPVVLELISRAQDELREQSLAAAAGIYSAKPTVHLQETGAAWDRWEAKQSGTKPLPAARQVSAIVKRRGSAA